MKLECELYAVLEEC